MLIAQQSFLKLSSVDTSKNVATLCEHTSKYIKIHRFNRNETLSSLKNWRAKKHRNVDIFSFPIASSIHILMKSNVYSFELGITCKQTESNIQKQKHSNRIHIKIYFSWQMSKIFGNFIPFLVVRCSTFSLLMVFVMFGIPLFYTPVPSCASWFRSSFNIQHTWRKMFLYSICAMFAVFYLDVLFLCKYIHVLCSTSERSLCFATIIQSPNEHASLLSISFLFFFTQFSANRIYEWIYERWNA